MLLVLMQSKGVPERTAQCEGELLRLRQLCVHAEPNYGLLWFFYKNSITDNAYDIWERALAEWKATAKTAQQVKQVDQERTERWLGSPRLVRLLRGGLRIRRQPSPPSTE